MILAHPLRNPFKDAVCALALTCAWLSVLNANASAQIPTPSGSGSALQGLQTVYLRAPILRYYAAESDAAPPISTEDLQLTNLTTGSNRRLYPKLDRVRAAIAADQALAVFLSDPRVAPELRAALQSATLYAGLPGPGASGLNEFNSPGNGLNPGRRIQPGKGGGNIGVGRRLNGFGTANNTAAAGRQGSNRNVRDFTVLVGLSRDGQQSTLFVLGSLPEAPNPAMPINLTVEGKQYASGDTDSSGVDRAGSMTVVDKQALPAASESARYFCYVYPLTTPPTGAQSDLLVSYWSEATIAVTHGIALTRTSAPADANANPAAQWIMIPMTRLQRYQPRQDIRYALLTDAQPGDPITDSYRALIRKTLAGKKQK